MLVEFIGKRQKSSFFLVARPLIGGEGGVRAWPLRHFFATSLIQSMVSYL